MYAAVSTRPDIACAVNICARHVTAPTQSDVRAVKRILRYLRNVFTRDPHTKFQPRACSDADWAGDQSDRKSTSGTVILLNEPVFWSSRKHSTVSCSSTEEKCIALAELCKEILWTRRVLFEIGMNFKPIQISEDNQSAIKSR